jgi:hypothetical protein
MGAPANTFRGYYAIAEVLGRLIPLASWLAAHRPDVKSITVARRDLDLIQRWPRAASLHDFVTTEDRVTYWRGFTLRPDNGPSRYEPPPPPPTVRPAIP